MPTETGPITILIDDAVTNAATMLLSLKHTTTGTPAAGIGALLEFQAESASGSGVVGVDIAGILTDVTNGGEKGALVLRTRTGGALSERWRVTDTGILQANGAQTVCTSTGALTLATNGGNGNIILSPQGSGKVGIGTLSPADTLNVYTPSTLTGITLDGGFGVSPAIRINTAAASNVNGRNWAINTNRNTWGDFNLYVGSAAGSDATAGSPALTILKEGGVGIGTTSPNYGAHILRNSSGGLDLLGLENNSTASVITKFAGLAFRGCSTGGTSKESAYLRAYPEGADYVSALLSFWTRASDTMTERWQITSQGVLQAMGGAQTIQTNTGALTLGTAGGNGNIIFSPHGTGMVTLGETTPTNFFHISSSACAGIDLMAVENSSSGNCLPKFAGYAFRGRDTSGNRMDTGYLRAYPATADYTTSRLSLWARSSTSAMAERAAIGVVKNVSTNNAALPLFDIALAAGQMTGGVILATIEFSTGTDHQALTQMITFAAVNKAGGYTTAVTVNASNNASGLSAGTLAASWVFATGTNKVTMQVTPNSSLGSFTIYRVTFTVFNDSPQTLIFL